MCKLCYNTETTFRRLLAKDRFDDSLIPLHWMSHLQDKYGCTDPGNRVVPRLIC